MINKGINRRAFLRLAAGAGVVASTSLFSSPFAGGQSNKIRIAVIDSLSGPLFSVGHAGRLGFVAAANHINERGGINGREVTLVFDDDATSDTNAAVQAATTQAQAGYDLLTGGTNSVNCRAIQPVADQYETLYLLGTSCEADASTGLNCSPYTFRPHNHDVQQAIALADHAYNQLGRKIFTIHMSNSLYAQSARTQFNNNFTALGGEILGEFGSPFNTQDWRPVIDQLMRAVSDARLTRQLLENERPLVLFIVSGQDAVRAYTAAVNRGLVVETSDPANQPAQVFGFSSLADMDILSSLGRAAVGTQLIHSYPGLPDITGTPFDNTANEVFRKEIRDLSGGEVPIPSKYTQQAYNAMMVFRTAGDEVGYSEKSDTPALINFLEGSGTRPEDPVLNPENEVGLYIEEGINFPQGNLFMRAADHSAFTRQFVVRVRDYGSEIGLAHEIIRDANVGYYPASMFNCDSE